MSSKIERVAGTAFHLPGNDIDTDRIIPARYLKCVVFDGLGEHVFADDRQQANGNHPFDQPQNTKSNILLVDANFGSGSSREHAPQALMRWSTGIQGLIGLSFADIFLGNCTANGMVCVTVSEDAHAQVVQHLKKCPNAKVSIDLERKTVHVGSNTYDCDLPNDVRTMLVEGSWDTIATLMEAGDDIEATEVSLPSIQLCGEGL